MKDLLMKLRKMGSKNKKIKQTLLHHLNGA